MKYLCLISEHSSILQKIPSSIYEVKSSQKMKQLKFGKRHLHMNWADFFGLLTAHDRLAMGGYWINGRNYVHFKTLQSAMLSPLRPCKRIFCPKEDHKNS